MVKTHHALVMDRGHPLINFEVTAGAVYIVRNPLDVAVSLANHIDGTIDDAIKWMETVGLETAIGEHSVYEVYGSWSQHVESWTRKPHEAIYVMRYEDMLADPDAHIPRARPPSAAASERRRIAIGHRPLLIREIEKTGRRRRLRGKTQKGASLFPRRQVRRLARKTHPRQVERIVRRHHKQMARFGYLTDELKHLVNVSRDEP